MINKELLALSLLPLTQSTLKRLLHYDAETGVFTWIDQINPNHKRGDVAGRLNKSRGYIDISIGGTRYKANRLAFMYMEGCFPEYIGDHDDGNKSNNSWKNLRRATFCQNGWNTKLGSDNKSGVKGLTWCNFYNMWRCSIQFNGKTKSKRFKLEDKEFAIEWLINIRQQLHGEFANNG